MMKMVAMKTMTMMMKNCKTSKIPISTEYYRYLHKFPDKIIKKCKRKRQQRKKNYDYDNLCKENILQLFVCSRAMIYFFGCINFFLKVYFSLTENLCVVAFTSDPDMVETSKTVRKKIVPLFLTKLFYLFLVHLVSNFKKY